MMAILMTRSCSVLMCLAVAKIVAKTTPVVKVLVGSRVYIGAARHDPRSLLYQPSEAYTMLLGDSSIAEHQAMETIPELDRHFVRSVDCFIDRLIGSRPSVAVSFSSRQAGTTKMQSALLLSSMEWKTFVVQLQV
jgi:hypothetical protein